jgi:HAD superfamily hydrolase (TIGR01509 family)
MRDAWSERIEEELTSGVSSPLRAELFDVGDTLVRLRGTDGSLLHDAAADLGVELSDAQAAAVWRRVLDRSGTPEELAKGRDLSPERHQAVWTALYAACGADELADGLGEALYARTIRAASWEAFPDTHPTLRALADRDVPVGLVSDTGFDLRPALHALGISRYARLVVQSFETGVCKPHPSVFARACRELACPASATLMVGDNPLTDGGAVAAGLTVLLLPPPSKDGTRGLGHVLPLLRDI